ncbi:hypothetical protein AGMMS49938_04320 [Fibrobacterales bacterium]|nr:hypothetical protein AGMMS49938_04320 [Fibrobacterales bacterium]
MLQELDKYPFFPQVLQVTSTDKCIDLDHQSLLREKNWNGELPVTKNQLKNSQKNYLKREGFKKVKL